MKISSRYYPTIILVTYMIFLLLGILLGFGPEHGGGGHSKDAQVQLIMTLESLA